MLSFPEWFKTVNPNARLSTREIAILVNKDLKWISNHLPCISNIKKHREIYLPLPDEQHKSETIKGRIYTKYFWKVSTIKTWLELNKGYFENAEKEKKI